MDASEKLKAVSDLVTKVVKDNTFINEHGHTMAKFGKDEFRVNEDGSVREDWFIKGHIAPVLLAHAMDLASDKEDV
jgi:hypothetical protein